MVLALILSIEDSHHLESVQQLFENLSHLARLLESSKRAWRTLLF